MDIQTEKIARVKRLLDTDDALILQQLKDVFECHEKFLWNDLPQHVQAGITRGLAQAEAGQVTPHNEVMEKYQQYL